MTTHRRRFQRYFRQLRTNPPQIIWQKAKRKISGKVRSSVGRVAAQWSSPHLTDTAFLQAIDDRFPTIQAFLDQMATRRSPRFFISPAEQSETVAALRRLCPASEASTIKAADEVCNHRFDLLGSGPVALGERIDWHCDFKSGHRWDPRQYYTDIGAAPYPGGYDLKMPWELSRCQHFAWLGQAYWFTGNEQFAQEFVAQVVDWIAQNPPRLGVNWACAMDVAIRAVNWLWGFYFFRQSATLSDEFRLAFFKSLLVHGRHIIDNLEFSETLTSNHYLSDVVGLVYLGILLPEFKEAQRWRSFGLQALEVEMFKQVYSDGANFEASISYHRLATELFLSATVLAQLNGHSFCPDYLERLEKMVEFTLFVTKPDGTVPLIGDFDNGRLHRLKAWGGDEREWLDHRHLLATGAVLFQRRDFAQGAGDQWEEALWLMGAQAVDWAQPEGVAANGQEQPASHVFPDAGIYLLRHEDAYVVVDAGPNGQNGNGGHAHNDALSFEWYQAGQTIVGDPGAFVYTVDHEARNHFRSTAVHNTIKVDGEEICRIPPDFLFTLDDDLHPTCLHWHTTPTETILVVEHSGYHRLERPVTCRRLFYLDHATKDLLTGDLILGEGYHQLEMNVQCLQTSCRLEIVDRCVSGRWSGGGFVVEPLFDPGWEVSLAEGEFSTSYGVRRSAPKFNFRRSGVLPAQLVLRWQFSCGAVTPAEIGVSDLPTAATQGLRQWLDIDL